MKTCTCHARPHTAACPCWRKRKPDPRTYADRVAKDPLHAQKKLRRDRRIPHDGLLEVLDRVIREGRCEDAAKALERMLVTRPA
jgi:hypothetical protein